MRALGIIVPILGIMAIAYRYYSAFIAAKVMVLDNSRVTPAHTKYDGANYYPTSRWVLFGHHFAAIAGSGPLVGPVLAAQFGYAPGLIWLVAGVCLAGAVQDSMMLWASTRRGGRSLAMLEFAPLKGSHPITRRERDGSRLLGDRRTTQQIKQRSDAARKHGEDHIGQRRAAASSRVAPQPRQNHGERDGQIDLEHHVPRIALRDHGKKILKAGG